MMGDSPTPLMVERETTSLPTFTNLYHDLLNRSEPPMYQATPVHINGEDQSVSLEQQQSSSQRADGFEINNPKLENEEAKPVDTIDQSQNKGKSTMLDQPITKGDHPTGRGKGKKPVTKSGAFSPLISDHVVTTDKTVDQWSLLLRSFEESNIRLPRLSDEYFVPSIREVQDRVKELTILSHYPAIPEETLNRLCSELTGLALSRQMWIVLFSRLFVFDYIPVNGTSDYTPETNRVYGLHIEIIASLIAAAYHIDGATTFATARSLSNKAKIAALGHSVGGNKEIVLHFALKSGRYLRPSGNARALPHLVFGDRFVAFFEYMPQSIVHREGEYSDYTTWASLSLQDYLKQGYEKFTIRPSDTAGLLELIHRVSRGDSLSKGWVYASYFIFIREMLMAAHSRKVPFAVVELENFMNDEYLPTDFSDLYEVYIVDSGDTAKEKDLFTAESDHWILGVKYRGRSDFQPYLNEWDDPTAELFNCFHSLGVAKQALFARYLTTIETQEESDERRHLVNSLPILESVFTEIYNTLAAPIEEGTTASILTTLKDFFTEVCDDPRKRLHNEAYDYHRELIKKMKLHKENVKEEEDRKTKKGEENQGFKFIGREKLIQKLREKKAAKQLDPEASLFSQEVKASTSDFGMESFHLKD